MQVAGGLAAMYPAGSIPISDAVAIAVEIGDRRRGNASVDAAKEADRASVEFEDDVGGDATPQQAGKALLDSSEPHDGTAAIEREEEEKVSMAWQRVCASNKCTRKSACRPFTCSLARQNCTAQLSQGDVIRMIRLPSSTMSSALCAGTSAARQAAGWTPVRQDRAAASR